MTEMNYLGNLRRSIKQRHLYGITTTLVMLICQPVQAVTADVTVQGVVIAKPKCVINDNQDINVPFGELNIVDIDGVNYGKKEIPYRVICNGNASGANGLMKVMLQGNGPGFGDGLLSTDTEGLAIKLYQGSQQLKLNEWLNFTYPDIPPIHAVAIKRSGVTLRGGDFSSSAILLVDIQ